MSLCYHGKLCFGRVIENVIKYDLYVKFPWIFAHNIQICAKFSCKNFTDVCLPVFWVLRHYTWGAFFVDILENQFACVRVSFRLPLYILRILIIVSAADCMERLISECVKWDDEHCSWHSECFTLLSVPTVKISKSKMAAAAILENRKIAISRPQFDRFRRNLTQWCSFALALMQTEIPVTSEKSNSEIGCLPYFHTWCGLSANLECMSEIFCMR